MEKKPNSIEAAIAFLFVGATLATVFLDFFCWAFEWYKIPGVKPGQTWVEYYGDTDNPFDAPEKKVRKVVAVKDGYTQYTNSRGDTISMATSSFVYGNTLQK